MSTMTVARILQRKGVEVTSLSPQHTMMDVISVLAERRIGCIVITTPDGRLSGIISERDVVRALAQQGPSALSEPVSAFMSSPVKTGLAVDTVDSIMDRMTDGKFRHVPILEDARVIGIVSIGDVVKYRIADAEAEASAMRDYIATA